MTKIINGCLYSVIIFNKVKHIIAILWTGIEYWHPSPRLKLAVSLSVRPEREFWPEPEPDCYNFSIKSETKVKDKVIIFWNMKI